MAAGLVCFPSWASERCVSAPDRFTPPGLKATSEQTKLNHHLRGEKNTEIQAHLIFLLAISPLFSVAMLCVLRLMGVIWRSVYGVLSCRAPWKANLHMLVLMVLIYYAAEAGGKFCLMLVWLMCSACLTDVCGHTAGLEIRLSHPRHSLTPIRHVNRYRWPELSVCRSLVKIQKPRLLQKHVYI